MGQSSEHHDYHLVDPSPWPMVISFSAMIMFIGLVIFFHDKVQIDISEKKSFSGGLIIFGLGLIGVLYVFYAWWKDVVIESVQKHHTKIVQQGLRIGMALFIVSELMFFFGFFWSFFKAALFPVVSFDGAHLFEEGVKVVEGVWPPESIKTFNPWDLPFINTLILLLSGTTVTWAHYAIIHNNRKDFIDALTITVILGFVFSLLQIYEYHHAAFGFKDGIYPSIFYMATGFHGVHVFIGTVFLLVCLLRAKKGQMDSESHLGFEFAAWYWHFVDVVWIFLFVFVYIWGK